MLGAYVAGNCFIFKAPKNKCNIVKVLNLLFKFLRKANETLQMAIHKTNLIVFHLHAKFTITIQLSNWNRKHLFWEICLIY